MERDIHTERLDHDAEVCALVQDLLPLYLEDEVSADSRALIVAHLNGCAHCAGFLRGAQSARVQFAREREREVGRRNAFHPPRLNVSTRAVPLIIGAVGLMASLTLVLALATYAFEQPLSSFLISIGSGAAINGAFLLVSVGIVGVLSVRLLRQRANLDLDVVVLVGLVFGTSGLLVPFAEPIYRVVGVVTLALAGLHQWLERQSSLKTWLAQKGKYIGGFLASTFGLTLLLAITLSNKIEGASFGIVPTSSYSGPQALPTAVPPDNSFYNAATPAPVWTPTPVALPTRR
ncbi:MAG: zf-HC2 domain-containing protein [Roseiflexaceae bacterium]|nr:zf-HC2 domain-containing protein [Roseiflexaceae bacterium]